MASSPLSLPLGRLQEPLQLHSRILDQKIWIVPRADDAASVEGPSYSVDECRLLVLLCPAPDELRAIHRAKVALDGQLLLPQDDASLRRLCDSALARFEQLTERLGADDGGEAEAELRRLAAALSLLMTHLP